MSCLLPVGRSQNATVNGLHARSVPVLCPSVTSVCASKETDRLTWPGAERRIAFQRPAVLITAGGVGQTAVEVIVRDETFAVDRRGLAGRAIARHAPARR